MVAGPRKLHYTELRDEERELRREAGAWLQSLRLARGLTQRALSEQLRETFYTFISTLELGNAKVPPERYSEYARILGLDAVEFTKAALSFYEPDVFRNLFGDPADGRRVAAGLLQKIEPIASDVDTLTPVKEGPLRSGGGRGWSERRIYSPSRAGDRELRREAGVWLKRAREACGLKQTDVAEGLGGKFFTFVSGIELGKKRVPPELFADYARILGFDVADFTKRMLSYHEPSTYEILFGDPEEQRAAELAHLPAAANDA